MEKEMDFYSFKIAWSVECIMLGGFLTLVGAFSSDLSTAKIGVACCAWGAVGALIGVLRRPKTP